MNVPEKISLYSSVYFKYYTHSIRLRLRIKYMWRKKHTVSNPSHYNWETYHFNQRIRTSSFLFAIFGCRWRHFLSVILFLQSLFFLVVLLFEPHLVFPGLVYMCRCTVEIQPTLGYLIWNLVEPSTSRMVRAVTLANEKLGGWCMNSYFRIIDSCYEWLLVFQNNLVALICPLLKKNGDFV